jgi:hypothetical protein
MNPLSPASVFFHPYPISFTRSPQGIPTLPELKLSYYELMVRYYSHYNNYLEMTRCYRAMYETETISADKEKWSAVSEEGRRRRSEGEMEGGGWGGLGGYG